MPKGKTHKGLGKRVKVTATGKLMHRQPGSGHLMSGKSGKRKRALRRDRSMHEGFRSRLIALLSR